MAVPKSQWGEGAWQREPDEREWTDDASGFACLVTRGPVGAWCGYVGVPADHPAHGKSYYATELDAERILELGEKVFEVARVQLQINKLQVHGGFTYAANHAPIREPDGLWWLGFNCAHAGDYCPACERLSDLGGPTGWGGVVEYRTQEYAEAQVLALAAQLAAIPAENSPSDMAAAGGLPPLSAHDGPLNPIPKGET